MTNEKTKVRLALYQPDMPSNTGTMMRMCACLGVSLDVIEPCGFLMTDAKLRRACMDYIDYLDYKRHSCFEEFTSNIGQRRLILLTTKSKTSYYDFAFKPDDVIMVGRESAGVPDEVHHTASACLTIPMIENARSLNVAISASLVLGEALRQTR